MWRQGDVLIESCPELPEAVVRQKRLVVAGADGGGHKHKIKDARTARLFAGQNSDAQNLYLEVTAPQAELVHPEHGTIVLTQGTYRVWQQREFTDRGARRVYD